MIELAAEVPLPPPRYPGVARALARHLARRAVEKQLQAQGRLVPHVPYAEVSALMQAYQAAHQEELLAQAMEAVRTNPRLRAMAEKEERQRQRQERKWRKQLGRNGVLDRPVCTTDNAKTPIENATEKAQPKGD